MIMEKRIHQTLIQILQGDITLESTDAIVNAANSGLAGGGGVDGAIHRAGGPEIMEQCRKIGGCPVGQAVITTGGRLPARYIIHTVGPVYRGGSSGEAALLTASYENSLKLACEKGLQSIAFPAISCGVYGYPIHEAAHLALKACIEFAQDDTCIQLIRHILIDSGIHDIFSEEFAKLI